MSDYVVRAISADKQVRGFATTTTHLVQELQRRHTTFPVASAALGRTATMGAMMGLTLKEEHHHLTIHVRGDGPLGQMMVDADGKGNVRGYVEHPEVLLPLNQKGKLDVATAVGQGSIYIVKDVGLQEPSRGTSPIISGELAEDFTYYFTTSEQTPSSVGLGVLVNRDQILTAGGYFVQVLPDASDETIGRLEERISSITSITNLLQEGITPEALLQQIMGNDIDVLERKSIQFQCHCSRDKVRSMLKGLGDKEIQSIIEDLGQAEVTCHFCNEQYVFNRTELQELIVENN
ncbi:Hsp33 family molecular chaperone HslO [Hazenella coriacea]|uniref:33 kDa chaperonin n=1 Tax=Hazenella coriacea TaxID=1179467 RepID=A0A4R3L5H9_9BACL|nr:Hsp33 family molecular chaperone HslO [Hazenella coriacea]TCS94278.1 molecular chaperone Hsp33 [Hazenella coriacea]